MGKLRGEYTNDYRGAFEQVLAKHELNELCFAGEEATMCGGKLENWKGRILSEGLGIAVVSLEHLLRFILLK
jgi:hypothetical protein